MEERPMSDSLFTEHPILHLQEGEFPQLSISRVVAYLCHLEALAFHKTDIALHSLIRVAECRNRAAWTNSMILCTY